MKRKLIMLFLLLIYFSPSICHGGVRGELNKKFAKSFPRKLVTFAITDAKQDDDILKAFINVIDEHSFLFIEDENMTKALKKHYNPFSAYTLPNQVVGELKNKTTVDGVLLMHIGNAPWLFDPFGAATRHARVIIYDAQSGEWAYSFEATCGFVIIPSTCSLTAEDMHRYFRNNFNHKMKHIKFRQ